MKILRIVFCILSCLCVLACVPAGVWLDWSWALVFVLGAAIFAIGMVTCKKKSEPTEKKRDFMDDDPPRGEK